MRSRTNNNVKLNRKPSKFIGIGLGLEQLEGRQLRSGVPSFPVTLHPIIINPVQLRTPLVYNATNSNDTVQLRMDNGFFNVVRNGQLEASSVRSVSSVSSIQLNLLAGTDRFTIADNVSTSIPITVNGGDGNDVMTGAAGAESFFGGFGNDIIYGRGGNDRIFGNYGNDSVFGEAGHDVVFGDAGDDYVSLGVGDDCGDGGAGNDTVVNTSGFDTMFGSDGNDSLYGGAGTDIMYGNNGNDTLVGGGFVDYMYGGAGDDLFVAQNDGSEDHIDGGAGYDTAKVDDAPWYAPWQDQDDWSKIEKTIKY